MLNDFGIIVLRSVAVYIFIVFAIRLFGKRELSQISVIDLVFILLLSNSVQNAMVGPDSSLIGGLIAATSLFLVNYILKKITYKNKKVNKLINTEPVLLIHNGKVNTENLKSQELTIEELQTAIREHSVESIKDVKLAMIEPDGNISIISNDHKYHFAHRKKAHRIISKID